MEKEKSPSFKNGGDDETPKCSNGKDPLAPDKPENNGTEEKGGGAEATPYIKYTMDRAWEDTEHFLVELEGDADSEIPDSINQYLDLVEAKASKHELPKKSKGCPLPDLDDDGSFLKVAHQMSKLHKHLSKIFKSDSRQGVLINRIGKTHQQEPAADSEGRDQAPRSNEVLSNFPGYSQEALATLNTIAMEVISGGYEFECHEAYILTRRNAIEEILNKLGFEKISIDDIQKMRWDALQREIPPWINAYKACANVYFSGNGSSPKRSSRTTLGYIGADFQGPFGDGKSRFNETGRESIPIFKPFDKNHGLVGFGSGCQIETLQRRCIEQHFHDEQWTLHNAKDQSIPRDPSRNGDNWYRKKSYELRNYHQSYKRETWMKLLGCLNVEGLNVNGKVVKPVLKERFKSFNAMFEEIHKTRSLWMVSDKQMQSELKVSIAGVIIPAYRSFLGRFSGCLTPGRQTEKYIKFQPEDIETYIEELFDGKTASTARKRT
ncbi:hypothetical protein F3Y22_tig00013040pilonHSYRG00081 [Hibiscus syriacus]|uniref:Exocyst subunit Exo70 family protein n=1 Tax=Hibiscus syriacus TaxID=106335 RepID=A0A6A3C7W0_HIBSY|nr:hypothetical protein F3Y22_tig00013040pilonHSYRG00081 [Hibiscus syriacus]